MKLLWRRSGSRAAQAGPSHGEEAGGRAVPGPVSAQRLAVAVVVTISIGYTFFAILTVASIGTFPHLALLTGALTGFFLPHYTQLRDALRGVQQRGLPAGLMVQTAATYAPLLAFDPMSTFGWIASFPPILAGTALLRLGPRRGSAAVAVITLIQAWWFSTGRYGTPSAGFYYGLTVFVTGFVIYGMVRLVVLSRELAQARADLAEAAVLQERLRISRDLHDGLGRSLTAIALKGDLAGRLLDLDPPQARTELTELVRVARDAAQDVRQVARGYREITLSQEVNRAVSLLEAGGIACTANVSRVRPAKGGDEALAWAVREGITNVLRHSRATTCSISTSVHAGAVRLEIVNDGVTAGEGTLGGGLTGLTERVAAVHGQVEAGRMGAEGFRLAVEVPA